MNNTRKEGCSTDIWRSANHYNFSLKWDVRSWNAIITFPRRTLRLYITQRRELEYSKNSRVWSSCSHALFKLVSSARLVNWMCDVGVMYQFLWLSESSCCSLIELLLADCKPRFTWSAFDVEQVLFWERTATKYCKRGKEPLIQVEGAFISQNEF